MIKKTVAIMIAVLVLVSICMPTLAADMKADRQNANGLQGTKNYTDDDGWQFLGEVDGFYYAVKDNEAKILGIDDENVPINIEIPEKVLSYRITVVGMGAFFEYQSIESIKMPYIRVIEEEAFGCCYDLKSVEMPAVVSVAGDAFVSTPWYDSLEDEFNIYGDGVLIKYNGEATDVTLPDEVKCVAGFYENEVVESVNTNNAECVESSAFYGCITLTSVEMPNVKRIGGSAFYECEELSTVNMTNVEDIGNFAFEYLPNLECIDIPHVKMLGDYAFTNCEKLTAVDLPAIEYIGDGAFCYCSALESMDMHSVKSIGEAALSGCISLTEIKVSDDNEKYTVDEGILFNKAKTELIAYPSASGDVIIPAGVKNIKNYAFECSVVKSVNTSDVEYIGCGAFCCCDAMEAIEMPNVYSVDSYAFELCSELKSVSMPKLNEASGTAFVSCLWYDEIEEEFAIYGDGVMIKYCGSDNEIVLPDEVKYVTGFCMDESIKSVNTNKAEKIGKYGFFGCTKLKSIEMPDVAYIGEDAFSDCEILKEVNMPEVEIIDEFAFSWDSAIETIDFMKVTNIAYGAFSGCMSLESVYFYCDAPSEFGEFVFEFCSDDFCIYYAEGTEGWETPEWSGYPCKPFTPETDNSVIGDLTGDGVVNTADAVVILKSSAGMLTLSDEQIKVADANRDGNINTADAVTILKYAAGLITEL